MRHWSSTPISIATYNSGGTTIARYQPEGEVQYSAGTATPYYYQRDHLGTPVSMTAATGTGNTPINILATDAYGLTITPPTTGTLPTFGYAGMFMHQPTASISPIYLTRNRAYDPYSGRWLSRDPIGEIGGVDLYGYVGESPLDFRDEYGLCGCNAPPGASGPGWLGSVGFGACGFGIGLTATSAGELYFDAGTSTPGPSASVMTTNSMSGYASGWNWQGGVYGPQGGSTPDGSATSSGIGTPGASYEYGFNLSQKFCKLFNDMTNPEDGPATGPFPYEPD